MMRILLSALLGVACLLPAARAEEAACANFSHAYAAWRGPMTMGAGLGKRDLSCRLQYRERLDAHDVLSCPATSGGECTRADDFEAVHRDRRIGPDEAEEAR